LVAVETWLLVLYKLLDSVKITCRLTVFLAICSLLDWDLVLAGTRRGLICRLGLVINNELLGNIFTQDEYAVLLCHDELRLPVLTRVGVDIGISIVCGPRKSVEAKSYEALLKQKLE
jgi:hypothetical protein